MKKILTLCLVIVVLSFSSYTQNSKGHGKSSYTSEEIKRMCGLPVDTAEMRRGIAKQDSMYKEYISKKIISETGLHKIETIPNWRGMMSPVEYQNDDPCPGDCWAHAASGIVEGQLHISSGSNLGIDLDEVDIVNGTGGCGTNLPIFALEYVQSSKTKSEVGTYPNLLGVRWGIVSCDASISGITAIKNALANGPVAACLSIYTDFEIFF